MNSIIYKRLFEVRILNDYYLMKAFADKSTSSFFSKPDQTIILDKILKLNQYDVSNYFEIKPLTETEALLTRYSIKQVNNQLGFFLGMEVSKNTTQTPDGESTITYEPKVTVPDDLNLQFSINSIDPDLYKRAILPTETHINSLFYFTNLYSTNNKTYPVIAEGPRGVVGSQDLKFLPFHFSIRTSIGKTINTRLSGVNDETIYENQKEALSEIVLVNVRKVNSDNGESPSLEDGLYDLKIEEDGTVIQEGKYFFSENYFRQSNFGIIDIHFKAEDSSYDLLENQKDLKTKVIINENGNRTIVKHPVYELRLKGDFSEL